MFLMTPFRFHYRYSNLPSLYGVGFCYLMIWYLDFSQVFNAPFFIAITLTGLPFMGLVVCYLDLFTPHELFCLVSDKA